VSEPGYGFWIVATRASMVCAVRSGVVTSSPSTELLFRQEGDVGGRLLDRLVTPLDLEQDDHALDRRGAGVDNRKGDVAQSNARQSGVGGTPRLMRAANEGNAR
jgi:hypothetical protein